MKTSLKISVLILLLAGQAGAVEYRRIIEGNIRFLEQLSADYETKQQVRDDANFLMKKLRHLLQEDSLDGRIDRFHEYQKCSHELRERDAEIKRLRGIIRDYDDEKMRQQNSFKGLR